MREGERFSPTTHLQTLEDQRKLGRRTANKKCVADLPNKLWLHAVEKKIPSDPVRLIAANNRLAPE